MGLKGRGGGSYRSPSSSMISSIVALGGAATGLKGVAIGSSVACCSLTFPFPLGLRLWRGQKSSCTGHQVFLQLCPTLWQLRHLKCLQFQMPAMACFLGQL